MPSSYRITLSIDEELHHALENQSEDEQRGIPDIVREAIHFYLADVAGEGIGTTAEKAIKEGKTNADALAVVRERFPRAQTTLSAIAYYRSRLRRTDKAILTNNEAEQQKRNETTGSSKKRK